jgi:hypothetical protein
MLIKNLVNSLKSGFISVYLTKVPSAETFNALIKLDLDAGVDVEVKL